MLVSFHSFTVLLSCDKHTLVRVYLKSRKCLSIVELHGSSAPVKFIIDRNYLNHTVSIRELNYIFQFVHFKKGQYAWKGLLSFLNNLLDSAIQSKEIIFILRKQ